jgi:threonine synthase
LANAVAAYGARAGLKRYVFIPSDLEKGKIIGALVYDPNLIAVNGNYDDVNRLCSEIAGKYKWAFVNINMRPYYAEGSKTLAFETAEQLGWQAPDQVVVPVASGSLLTKIWKGTQEMIKVGLISQKKMRVFGAQAAGCSPVTTAYKAKVDTFRPVKPNTIAKSLAIGNPADGYYALKTIAESNGGAEMATDEEIIEGIKLLAQTEGIFAETAGGVTIACLKKLAEAGTLDRDAVTVAYITGTGLKTQEAVADHLREVRVIQPNLEAFEASQLTAVS